MALAAPQLTRASMLFSIGRLRTPPGAAQRPPEVMGSLLGGALSPTRLGHARDHAVVRELAQADPAEAELLVDRAWPPAAVAAGVAPHAEARLTLGFGDQGLLSHVALLPLRTACRAHARAQDRPGRPRRWS